MDPSSSKVDNIYAKSTGDDVELFDSRESLPSSDGSSETSDIPEEEKEDCHNNSKCGDDDESTICDFCCRNMAAKFCVDCSYNYCLNCLNVHVKIPSTKDHKLEEVDCTRGNMQLFCSDHQMKKTLACQNCSAVLCPGCMSPGHKDHKVKHIMEFIESTKKTFEQNLKPNKESLENISSSIRNAEMLIAAEEAKTSNLIDQISKRSEDAKKAIDEYVEKVKKQVDDKLNMYLKIADDFLLKMKNMESSLKEEIESIDKELKDLSCLNVAEFNSKSVRETQSSSVPTFNRKFRVFSLDDSKENKSILETFVGGIVLGPDMKIINEKFINATADKSAISGFILDQYSDCVCNVDAKHLFGSGTDINMYLDAFHSLVIGNCLYVGSLDSGNFKVNRFEIAFERKKKLEIFSRPLNEKSIPPFKMSKSCSGNILLTLDKELLHLNTDGTVEESLSLNLNVSDAVQLDDNRYVVCCNNRILIIDNKGETILEYSPSEERHNFRTPRRLTKDVHGFIYVIDSCIYKSSQTFSCGFASPAKTCVYDEPNRIIVLDYDLNFISSHKVKEDISDVFYCEKKDMLLVKTKERLLWFKL